MEMQSALSSIFGAAGCGDFSAAHALYNALYSELHEIAKAYIEMVERERSSFPDGAVQQRGGRFQLTSAETDPKDVPIDRDLSHQRCLDELAKTASPLAELVDLKFFGLGRTWRSEELCPH